MDPGWTAAAGAIQMLMMCVSHSNKECPTCRKKLVSKRSLRPDPNFDALISKSSTSGWFLWLEVDSPPSPAPPR